LDRAWVDYLTKPNAAQERRRLHDEALP
jgi:hypothetical protein